MIYNSQYFDHMYTFNMVSRKYRRKVFYEDDFLAWCQQVETQVIPDVDLMVDFQEIGIKIVNDMVLLPCNIHRLLDVYDSSNNVLSNFQTNGSFLYSLLDNSGNKLPNGSTIYLNYKGTNVDLDSGIPLCLRGHEFICETYCKIQAFEEDVALKNFNGELYASWMQALPGLINAAKQDPFQHKTRAKVNQLLLIKGNMIPKIGNLPLVHKEFIS